MNTQTFFKQEDKRLSLNFEKLVDSNNDHELKEVPLEYQTLKEPLNDFEIKEKYQPIKPIEQILNEMYSVIISGNKDLKDGDVNVWYYLDEQGRLSCAYGYWTTGNYKWKCDGSSADHSIWDAGTRVFSSSPFKPDPDTLGNTEKLWNSGSLTIEKAVEFLNDKGFKVKLEKYER